MSLKPFKTNQQIINHLKSKQLLFKNNPDILHIFNTITYYRLKAYSYPFEESIDIFKPNTYFEDSMYKLYCIDERLRTIIFPLIMGIEIAFRTQIINCISSNYDSFGEFLQSVLTEELDFYKKKFSKSNNMHIVYARENKKLNYNQIEPWIALEMYEFGSLIAIYDKLSIKHKDAIRQFFTFKTINDFKACITLIKNLRNIIAHHENIICRYSYHHVKQYALSYKYKALKVNSQYNNLNFIKSFPLLYPQHRKSGYNPNTSERLSTFYPTYLAVILLSCILKLPNTDIQNFIEIVNDNADYLGILDNWKIDNVDSIIK